MEWLIKNDIVLLCHIHVKYSIHFTLSQERLKKLKSEHGKVQLGNITVDMVHVFLALLLALKLIILVMSYSFVHFSKGAWWNERNDRTSMGNFIT